MQQGGNREFLSVGNVWTTAGGYPIEKWVDSELLDHVLGFASPYSSRLFFPYQQYGDSLAVLSRLKWIAPLA